jgi:hypothetical protein
MKTAKEKANELGNKFYRGDIFTHGKAAHLLELEQAKQCALIAVDEVINSMTVATSVYLPYWQEVKQEIQLL